MTVQDHRKLIMPMLITKLGQHSIIPRKPWMKKHGIILDMKTDQLTFWPGHCQHITTKSCAAEPHAAEPCIKKPLADTLKTILKQSLNAQLRPLFFFFSSTPKVSKVLRSVPEAVIPQQKKVSEGVILLKKKS